MRRHHFHTRGLGQLKAVCDEAGIKLTPQRLEIFKALMAAKDHPSAEDVYRRLQARMPTIALDTVYRTLATFDGLGIARKLHLASQRNLFDTNLTPHHHFICDRCQKVADITWPDFDRADPPAEVTGIGRVDSRHLELHGVCTGCLEAKGR